MSSMNKKLSKGVEEKEKRELQIERMQASASCTSGHMCSEQVAWYPRSPDTKVAWYPRRWGLHPICSQLSLFIFSPLLLSFLPTLLIVPFRSVRASRIQRLLSLLFYPEDCLTWPDEQRPLLRCLIGRPSFLKPFSPVFTPPGSLLVPLHPQVFKLLMQLRYGWVCIPALAHIRITHSIVSLVAVCLSFLSLSTYKKSKKNK